LETSQSPVPVVVPTKSHHPQKPLEIIVFGGGGGTRLEQNDANTLQFKAVVPAKAAWKVAVPYALEAGTRDRAISAIRAIGRIFFRSMVEVLGIE
jgi:hypothetical protein